MKLPRVRVTVRQLMIGVILAAIVLGAFEAGRRWERSDDIEYGVKMPAGYEPKFIMPELEEPKGPPKSGRLGQRYVPRPTVPFDA